MKPENGSGAMTITENGKLEYHEAIRLWQDDSRLRRLGLAFSASFQGIVLAALSSGYGDEPMIFVSLAALAIFVSLLSLNNDRRLSCYMEAYETRLLAIEEENSLSLVHTIIDVARKRTPFFTNEVVFGTFFTLLAIGWGAGIIWKLWTLFK